MKVLHCSYSALPDPPGGTELYVGALCRALKRVGVDSVVIAPGASDRAFEEDGYRTRTFALRGPITLESLYGGEDKQASDVFGRLLDQEAPDVVHQHALSPACSVQLMREAKRRGLAVVFTHHTPAVSCQRGTLMEWGRSACDGRLDVGRCTACSLHALGGSEAFSRVLAQVPVSAGAAIGHLPLSGGAFTALRMTSLLATRHAELRALWDLADQIVVLAPWTQRVLRANDVPEHKVLLCPHGIEVEGWRPRIGMSAGKQGLKVVHLGRVDPGKGTRLLIDAFKALPQGGMTLDVIGVVQSESQRAVLDDLVQAAAGDPRIRFLPPVRHAAIVETLAAYDLVAVPSQLLETGPLVVLEAFAAGVPVIGSKLGGIADKVAHEHDGLLVDPPDSLTSWRDALDRCQRFPEFVHDLANGIRPPKSVTAVADEMLALYSRLLVHVVPLSPQ